MAMILLNVSHSHSVFTLSLPNSGPYCQIVAQGFYLVPTLFLGKCHFPNRSPGALIGKPRYCFKSFTHALYVYMYPTYTVHEQSQFDLEVYCSETLPLKVLNFWKFTSYCSLKPLWSGMGEVVPARTSPTLHPPSSPTVHQLSRLAL